jgi:histidinol-phosphate aminotransferase
MNSYWGDVVKKLTPYEPGEQPKNSLLLKLNTNENPYAPSPKVLKAIKASVKESLRLYPDPESMNLKASIANYYGLEISNIFVGNGSDEILAFIFQALLKKSRPIFFPRYYL